MDELADEWPAFLNRHTDRFFLVDENGQLTEELESGRTRMVYDESNQIVAYRYVMKVPNAPADVHYMDEPDVGH